MIGRPVSWPFGASRLLVELLIVVALAEFVARLMLPVIAHDGSTGMAGSLLDALLVALLAGPAIYWRSLAAMQRGRDASSGVRTYRLGKVWSAVAMTAAAQVLGLAITIAAVHLQNQELQADAQRRFDLGAERIETEIKRRFSRPVYGLKGIRGAYAAHDLVSRADFRAHVDIENLSTEYPGVYSFGFAQRVMRNDLPRFVAAARSDGVPDFAVHTSGQAPDLFVVKFVEPLRSHYGALGFDLGQEAVRREAVQRAVRSGQVVLSGRIKLLNDDKGAAAFLYLMPVYRAGIDPATPQQRESAALGLLYTPIVVGDILAGVAKVADDMLDLVLYDGNAVDVGEIVFDEDKHLISDADSRAHRDAASRMFVSKRSLVIGGRSFMLEVSSRPEFEAAINPRSVSMVAVIGAAASLLMAMAVWLLAIGRVRAQGLAQRMTADIDRLARVAQHTSNAVVITDARQRIIWVNSGFTRISGYTLAEAQGHTPAELLSRDKAEPTSFAALVSAKAAGETRRIETLNRARDGRDYWLDADIQPMHDADGVLTGFMEIGTDITEQKRIQLQLEAAVGETDALLRTVHQHAIVSVTDRNGEIIEVNDAFCAISGYSRDELLGQDHRILNSGLRPRSYWEDMWRTISDGAPWRGETCNRARDGSLHWVDSMIAPIHGADGRIEKYVSIRFDITASKAAQHRLTEMTDRLTLAVEGGNDGLWDWPDINAEQQWWSPSYYALLGYRPDELPATAESFNALLHPDFVEPNRLSAIEAMAGGKSFDIEHLLRTKSGQYRWFRSRAKVFRDDAGKVVRMAGSTQDIHERKLAERDLTRERRRLSDILEATNVGTWEWDVQSGAVHFNERSTQIMGLTLAELRPTTTQIWNSRVHPQDLARASAQVERHLRGELDHYELEVRLLHKDGRWIWVLSRGKVTSHNEDGSPRWMAGTYTDISERKFAEAETQRSQALLRASIDALDAAFALFDMDDKLLIWNQRYQDLYPLNTGAIVVGNTFEQIIRAGAERGQYRMAVGQVEAWVAERMATHRQEYSQLRQELNDGRVLRVVERRLPDGHTVSFRIDITDMAKATAQAEAASRAKSHFLANMSHEIRTPMNAILGMLKLLQSTALTATQLDYASKTEGAARSLLGLLNDILDFSKIEAGKMVLDLRPFRLDRMLRELSVILSANAASNDVEVLYDIDPAVPSGLLGDDMRLQQVLINLGGNAIKFTSKGEVVLRVNVVEQSQNDVTLDFSVRDSGIGIAPENQTHIFTGFSQAESSTTRRFGGSGLGLAICQRLVRMMGGEIGLDSAVGEGSCFHFRLRFELAQSADVELDDQLCMLPIPRMGDMHTLIVDDHPNARKLLGGMAQSLGWRVELATNGMEAIALVRARLAAGDPFRAILIDWQMSELDGWQTSLRIRELSQRMDVEPLLLKVCAHGGATPAERSAQEQAILNGSLVKPVTASMLFDALAQAHLAQTNPGRSNQAATVGVKQPRLAGVRLLLVEDNPTNQRVAQELLRAEGATVELADNGAAGVAAVRAADPQFDAVLMDLQMPVMDGFAAARQIRQQLGLTALPIIAMTANVMARDREACFAAGMNDHVAKPFELSSLVATLRRHIDWPTLAPVNKPRTGASRRAHQPPAELLEDAQRRSIDLAAALERMGGNLAVYQQMMQSFLKDLAAQPEQLAVLLEQGLRAEGRRLMHTLKGVAATLGAQSLSTFAAQAEQQLAGAQAPDHDQALMARFRAQVEASLQDITHIAEALEGAAKSSQSKS